MKRMAMICFVTIFSQLLSSISYGETIKFASIFAKSGEAGSANLHHVQAVRFAVDEINNSGGLLGKQIEIVEFDNKGTPIQSKLAAMKAVKSGVVAVVGASWSDHSLAMAPVVQRAKIPMISPDSTNIKVTRKGDYIFRACFIDPFQGSVLAKFAVQEFNAKKAAILEDVSSSYSQGLADAFKESFESFGGEITARLEYTKADRDFSAQLASIKGDMPDVLFIPGHDESGRIVKQAQDAGITAKMMGGDGWGYREFMSNGGRDLVEGYYSTHWTRELDTEKSKSFVEAYQKVYEINDFAAVTYDAVMLMANAIRSAGSLDGSAIRDALAATKDFVGVTGVISMDEHGDPIKSAVILKIENGKAVYKTTVRP